MVEALLEQVPWLTPTSLFLLLNAVIATILVSSTFNKKPHRQQGGTRGGDFSSSSSDGGDETARSFHPPPQQQQHLARAPSLFSRVTSFNFSNYYPDQQDHQQQQQLHHYNSSPSLFSRVASFKFSGRGDETREEEENQEQEPEPEPEPKPKQTLNARYMSKNHVTSKTEDKSETRAVARAAYLLSRVASFTLPPRGPRVEVDPPHSKNGDGKKVGEEEQGKVKVKVKVKKEKKVVENETATFQRDDEEVDSKADDFISRFKQQLKLQRLDSLIRCKSS